MRIAVLILAHSDLWQLEKLVERLSTDFDVYIHADAKWMINADHFADYNNVFFVKRHSVNWGSYIQILATIELFKASSLKDYDYYLLISGHDVPIKSNSFIKEFLAGHKNVSFVNSEILPKKEWAGQGGGYARLYYYFGIDFKNTLAGKFKRKLLSVIQRFQLKFDIKRKLLPISYYGGWNWVNLNREAVVYLLSYLADNPSYQKSFKYTYCADEIWLQTILLNSPLRIENNNMRYTSWEDHASHPKILVSADVSNLKSSNDLFARKFNSKIDGDVIRVLYEMTE